MKKILFALFLAVSCNLMASGKISVEPRYFFKAQKAVPPTIGFGLYEHLAGGVHYNGWTGIGFQPREYEPSVMWVTSRHDLEKHFGDLCIGMGITLRHAEQEIADISADHDIHVKFALKLW